MSKVQTGLERWLEDAPGTGGSLRPGARIGLLAHPASVDAEGRHAVERILDAGRWRLERIFAPEHGLHGHEQDMETVGHARDEISGVPAYSLYGPDAASLQVPLEQLDGLDAVLVDLQDVGSRYYTYAYTMAYLMETAAAGGGLPVIVLDRPNPIGGDRVEGPVLQPELSSFVGRYPIPVRHGMTLGELARLFQDAFDIRCPLTVVPMRGWTRTDRFRHTGLPWVAPSPNMPSPVTAEVYPGACLLEGTNLSEARGTTQPFELVGAPWLDGAALARSLRAAGLPGVVFRIASFRPVARKFAGEACRGVQVIPRDEGSFRPFETYLWLIRESLRLAPEEFAWRTEPYEFETERLAIDLLLGDSRLRPMLEAGAAIDELVATWSPELKEFESTRSACLLY